MNQKVSTIDPFFTPAIQWSESPASTDINLPSVRPDSTWSDFTWTDPLALDLDENLLKKYLDDKVFSPLGLLPSSRWNFLSTKKASVFNLNEYSTYCDKKVKIYKVELDNSTTRQEQTIDINKEIENLFELANEEEFEDGMESGFSKKLISLIIEYGANLIEELMPIFINEKANAEIISEALRWIGRIEHPETENIRLWLLERCLFCSLPSIRDGATLGLASMNDLSAKYSLRKAIKKEPIKELREDMKETLLELETYEDAATFKKDQEK